MDFEYKPNAVFGKRLFAFGEVDECKDHRLKIDTIKPALHQSCHYRIQKEAIKTRYKGLTHLDLLTKNYSRATTSHSDSSPEANKERTCDTSIKLQLLPRGISINRSAHGYISLALKSGITEKSKSEKNWDVDVKLRPVPELAKTRLNMYHTTRDSTLHLGLKLDGFLPSVSSRLQASSPRIGYLQDLEDQRLLEETRNEMTRIFHSKPCHVCKMSNNHDGIAVYSPNLLTARSNHAGYNWCGHNKTDTSNQVTEIVPLHFSSQHGKSVSSMPSTPKKYRDIRSATSNRGSTNRPNTVENGSRVSDETYANHSASLANMTKTRQSYCRTSKAKTLQNRASKWSSGTNTARLKLKGAENTREYHQAKWPSAQDIQRLRHDSDREANEYGNITGQYGPTEGNSFLPKGHNGPVKATDQNEASEGSPGDNSVVAKESINKRPDIIVPCHTLGECELCTSHWASKGLHCKHEETNETIKTGTAKEKSQPRNIDTLERPCLKSDKGLPQTQGEVQEMNFKSDVNEETKVPQSLAEAYCTDGNMERIGSSHNKEGRTIEEVYKDYSEEPYIFQNLTRGSTSLRYLHGRPKEKVPDLTNKLLFRLSYMKVGE